MLGGRPFGFPSPSRQAVRNSGQTSRKRGGTGWFTPLTKSVYRKQLSAFQFVIKGHVNAMASVKGGWALIKRVISLFPIIGLHTTSSRVRAVFVTLKHISRAFYHNGPKGACLLLKVNAVILQQSIGGHRVPDITSIGCRVKRNHAGLPRLIPRVHRGAIRAGDTALVRFYLSLFSIYRLIEFNGNYDVNKLIKTIISPAATLSGFSSLKGDLLRFIPIFWVALGRIVGQNARALSQELMREYKDVRLVPLLKSSPTTVNIKDRDELSRMELEEQSDMKATVSSHPTSVIEAARRLDNNLELQPSVMYFLDLVSETNPVREIWRRCVRIPMKIGKPLALGKLSLKQEAAGKIRVFAMVDPWTQWLLRPLHNVIFNHILNGIDQDGTMDQIKPIKGLLKSDPSYLASLDLSAATDRLPIWLQESLLIPLLGKEGSSHWRNLLVNRDYSLHIGSKTEGPGYDVNVRYAVGQPMGALSSWAMLALTHHFIVQFCAYKAGRVRRVYLDNGATRPGWFTKYAILGDDIVIADKEVAEMYLSVMSTLGVGIGLHKSLISGKGVALEFAKRTFWMGVDVSPVSFQEIAMAMSSPAGAVTFIKKYNLSLASFLKAAGYGYRVLGGLNRPLGVLSSKVRLIVLALNMPVTVEEITNFFSLGQPKSGIGLVETVEVIDHLVNTEFKRIKRALNELRYNLYTLELAHMRAKFIASTIWNKLPINDSVEFGYLFALIKEIMYQTQSHAKGVALVVTDQLTGQVTHLMLNRYDLSAAQLLESLIGIQKAMANLPLGELSYARVLDDGQRTMSDTTYIRLWKTLSGILQGTKSAPSERFGIGF